MDTGCVFPDRGPSQQLRAEITLGAMDKMGYNAMNLSACDFRMGTGFLLNVMKEISFPLISSNLVLKETGEPFAKTFAVCKTKRGSVGVVGVMPEDAFSSSADLEPLSARLRVIEPQKALRKILPDVRKQADVIVLLSQYGEKETRALLDAFEDIDVAVFSQSAKGAVSPLMDGRQKMVQVSHRSVNLGQLKLTIDSGSRKIEEADHQQIKLSDSIESDPVYVQLIKDKYDERNRKERFLQSELERREIEKDQAELMKLSPAEYIELMQKQNSQGSVVK